MANRIRELIGVRCAFLEKTIESLEKQIRCFPEGNIHVRFKKNNKPYYFLYEKNKGENYVNKKNKTKIEKHIQKDYLEKSLSAAKAELEALEKLRADYPEVLPEDIYEKLPECRRKYATPIVPGDSEYARQWLEKPYDKLGFKSGMPEYITIKGDRVRSKSEMIIADRLWANGIPYKYECPALIGNAIIHPDFTILRLSDRKILYHEHCGMMDNDEYREDMVDRVNEYNLAGIYLGDRLFLSFESSKTPLDARVIDNLIKTHFR